MPIISLRKPRRHWSQADRELPSEAPLDPNVLLLGSGSKWWEVLGVSRTASRAEIVNAYRALAKKSITQMWEAMPMSSSGCGLRMKPPFGKLTLIRGQVMLL